MATSNHFNQSVSTTMMRSMNMRNYNMGNQMNRQIQQMRQFQNTMDRDEQRRIANSVRSEQRRLRDSLKRSRQMYRQNSRFMSQADRQAYRVLYRNRRRDLRDLEREARYRFRDIEESGTRAFNSLGDQIESISEKLRDWKVALDVGDIAGGVTDSVQTVFDSQKDLHKLTGAQLKDLQRLSDEFRDRSKRQGNKISSGEYMESSVALASMGYKNLDFIRDMSEVMTELQHATGKSVDEMSKLAEFADTIGNAKSAKQVGNIAKALSENQNLYANSADMLTTFETAYDSIAASANGDINKFNKLMNEQLKLSAVASSNYFEYDAMKELIDNIKNGDQDTLVGMSALGLNATNAKQMAQQGEYTEVARQIITSLNQNIDSIASDELRKSLLDMTGIDNVASLRKIDLSYLNESIVEAQNSINSAYETDFIQKFIDEEVIGPFTKFKNWISNTKLGASIEQFLGETGMDMTDALLIANMSGGLLKGGGKMFGSLGRMLGFGGGAGATAGAGGGIMGTLGGILGSASGGGILGSLSSLAISLGAGNLAGGASLSAGALAGVGGASVLGGIGGLAGIGAGLWDIFKGFKEDKGSKERQDKMFSGGTKIGMVGAGAGVGAAIGSVVPVVGTAVGALVGAGVGGIGAILSGTGVGEWLSDQWDAFKAFIPKVGDWFKNLGSSMSNWIKTKWTALGDWVKKSPEMMKQALTDMAYNVGVFVGKSATFFEELPANMYNSITGMYNTAKEWVIKTGTDMGQWIADTWTGFITWVTDLPENILNGLSNTWNTVSGWITGVGKSMGELVSKSWNALVDWATNLPKKISEAFQAGLDKLGQGWDWLKSTVSSMASAFTQGTADGSHKDGLDRVPFDGYKAIVHKDEAILTAEQAKQWRSEESAKSSTSWFRGMIGKVASTLTKPIQALASASTSEASGGASLPIGDVGDFVGAVSAKYEVGYPRGNAGMVSSGANDPLGGISYGIPQFSTKQGSADAFAKWLVGKDPRYAKYLSGKKAGTPDFSTGWRSAYSNYPDDFTKQQAHYSNTKYMVPWMNMAKGKTGVDFNANRGFQELAKSMSVQHGPNSSKYLEGVSSSMSPSAIVAQIFKNRHMKAAVPTSKRWYSEESDIMGLLGQPSIAYKQGTPWVPNDQIALLHKGEMVIPEENNPLNKSGSKKVSSYTDDEDSDLQELIQVFKWGIGRIEKKLEETSNRSSESRSPRLSDGSNRQRKSDAVFQF